MYFFLWSFTDTCQRNLPTNLLADVDLFQEYVRLCTRNLIKMKKNADFLEDAKLVSLLCKVPSVTQRLGTQGKVLPDKLNLCPLLFHIKWLFPSPASASTGLGLGATYGTAGIQEGVWVW